MTRILGMVISFCLFLLSVVTAVITISMIRSIGWTIELESGLLFSSALACFYCFVFIFFSRR